MIECTDDWEAIRLAAQLRDGRLVEIWDEARRVARLGPEEQGRAQYSADARLAASLAHALAMVRLGLLADIGRGHGRTTAEGYSPQAWAHVRFRLATER
jgi:hypothetical protein